MNEDFCTIILIKQPFKYASTVWTQKFVDDTLFLEKGNRDQVLARYLATSLNSCMYIIGHDQKSVKASKDQKVWK